MDKNEDLLLIFTRNPEAGKVKKRLAADIGEKSALKVYELLLKHTASVTKDLPCRKRVYYSERIQKDDFWDESFYEKKVQKGEDLGERMQRAFDEGFADGFKKIIVIGSDLYDFQKEDLEKAFFELRDSDFVLGPAQDGGYYLFGMNKVISNVFKNKKWGTSSILKDTMTDLKKEKVAFLQDKNDIDNFKDLQKEEDLMKLLKNKNVKI